MTSRAQRLPSTDRSGTGDELINVMVFIPEKLNDQERSAFESLRDQPDIKPDPSTTHRLFSKLKQTYE